MTRVRCCISTWCRGTSLHCAIHAAGMLNLEAICAWRGRYAHTSWFAQLTKGVSSAGRWAGCNDAG